MPGPCQGGCLLYSHAQWGNRSHMWVGATMAHYAHAPAGLLAGAAPPAAAARGASAALHQPRAGLGARAGAPAGGHPGEVMPSPCAGGAVHCSACTCPSAWLALSERLLQQLMRQRPWDQTVNPCRMQVPRGSEDWELLNELMPAPRYPRWAACSPAGSRCAPSSPVAQPLWISSYTLHADTSSIPPLTHIPAVAAAWPVPWSAARPGGARETCKRSQLPPRLPPRPPALRHRAPQQGSAWPPRRPRLPPRRRLPCASRRATTA